MMKRRKVKWMERSKRERESLNVCMRHDEWGTNTNLEPWATVWCARNQTRTTLRDTTEQTNKRRALTSLQLVYSCVFTCFRFASTLNMLLCLLFSAFVSLTQSSSIFPYIDFSPVCEFLAIPCNCSHCKNGSFEVLSLHTPSVTVDRRQL